MTDSATSAAGAPYWRLSSFYFFYFALLGAWLPYWPLYLRELGFTPEKIGYIAGAMMATKIIAPNIWGYLADRSGRRMRIIRGGSLLALLCFLAIVPRQDFAWMMLVVIGYSFFWNAVLAQFEVVTLSHLAGRYQRYSLVRVWGSIGFITTVSLLGSGFDRYPLHWLPYIVIFLLAGIWVSSLLVDEHPDAKVSHHERRPLREVLAKPSVIAFFAVCFLMQASHGPYYTFFSVYLENNGFNHGTTGLLWSLGVIAEVVVFLFMHRLLHRFSLYQIMVASLLLSILRWWLIAFLVKNTVILVLAQTLHAASFGSFHAFAVEMVRKLFAGGLQGQGMAFYSGLSFGAGGAAGAVLSGWLWDYNPTLTFVMAGFACVLALAIAVVIREPLLHERY